jgi:hypothetical protein
MRSDFPFQRGGFANDSVPPARPEGAGFVQVPDLFIRNLSPEQWKALQDTYRAAWEQTRRGLTDPDTPFGGAENYQI